MSSVYTVTGVAAIGATNLGISSQNISTYTTLIDTTQWYTQVSTCTTTNNAIVLPLNPTPNQKYTIRNDGLTTLGVCPQGTGSSINQITILDPTNAQQSIFYVGPGGQCDFSIATNSGRNPPVLQWYTSNYSGNLPLFLCDGGVGFLSSATLPNQQSCILQVSSFNYYTIILPAPTVNPGMTVKAILTDDYRKSVAIASVSPNIYGIVENDDNVPVFTEGVQVVAFGPNATKGDYMNFTCDGTAWNIVAQSQSAGGLIVYSNSQEGAVASGNGDWNLGYTPGNFSLFLTQIPDDQYFTQVQSSTAANNGILLPINPIYGNGLKYTIRNDGQYNLTVVPPTAGSTINGLPALNLDFPQLSSYYIGPGAVCSFIATAQAGGAGGAVTWFSCGYSGNDPVFGGFVSNSSAIQAPLQNSIILASGNTTNYFTNMRPVVTVDIGLQYNIFIQATGSSNAPGFYNSTDTTVYGLGLEATSTNLGGQGQHQLGFALGQQTIGDWMEYISDGIKTYVKGMAHGGSGFGFN